jgi:oligopeptide/dipeptide ABC transporter ATP-binding protein
LSNLAAGSRHEGTQEPHREPDGPADDSAEQPLLSVRELSTHFVTDHGVVKAVDRVSLDIAQGEIVGLVGETGSGKSVTGASILNLVREPGQIVSGSVLFEGADLTRMTERDLMRIRGSAIALIVQNVKASLNPLLPIGAQIMNVYRAHLALNKNAARELLMNMLQTVGFDDPRRVARSYPHQLSGGMAQRTLLALALGLSPKLIIADEPTSGLDATVQVEVLNTMSELIRERGTSMLLITHDFGVVSHYCDSVAVMYGGRLVERATVQQFFAHPAHPYSLRLLSALGRTGDAQQILSRQPELNMPTTTTERGCNYAHRCSLTVQACLDDEPPMIKVAETQYARCIRCHEVAGTGESGDAPRS